MKNMTNNKKKLRIKLRSFSKNEQNKKRMKTFHIWTDHLGLRVEWGKKQLKCSPDESEAALTFRSLFTDILCT